MPPTAEPDATAAPPRPTARDAADTARPPQTFRARLAARLPEILIEALFVLIAVLLAFLVEEWREERELDRIAEEARVAIVQELRHNHDELLESRQDITDAIAALETALATEPPVLAGVTSDFEIALLSTAAWRSAQSMEAARRMDHTWMLTVARAYELQTLYEQAQWAALDANMAFTAARDESERADAASRALARIRFVAAMGRALEGDYDDIL